MAMDYCEKELKRLGDGDLANIVARAHNTFQKRHPDWNDIALPSQRTPAKEAKAIQLSADEVLVKLTPADQERQLRNAMRPFVREYSAATVLTPHLIDHVWQGIWKVIGERVEYEYQVPPCDRTTEELAQLQKESRAVLLLPGDIYTPDGLVRLGRAFPSMRSWTTDPKNAVDIFHSSTMGGSIDTETSIDAPYRTPKGYNQQELVERIIADGRRGMRLPTYLVGSQFSQLLIGQHFDTDTWSRLPGSSYGGVMLVTLFGSDSEGRAIVSKSWAPQDEFPYLGGRSEGVKRA